MMLSKLARDLRRDAAADCNGNGPNIESATGDLADAECRPDLALGFIGSIKQVVENEVKFLD
jgi:hypothetical protein